MEDVLDAERELIGAAERRPEHAAGAAGTPARRRPSWRAARRTGTLRRRAACRAPPSRRISSSVCSMMPLPWLMRWIVTACSAAALDHRLHRPRTFGRRNLDPDTARRRRTACRRRQIVGVADGKLGARGTALALLILRPKINDTHWTRFIAKTAKLAKTAKTTLENISFPSRLRGLRNLRDLPSCRLRVLSREPHPQPAVDCDRRSGHRRRFLGRHERHDAGDLRRAGHPARGIDSWTRRSAAAGSGCISNHSSTSRVRVHPGQDRVDADAERRAVERQARVSPTRPDLAAAYGNIPRSSSGVDRGDVDDGPAARASPCEATRAWRRARPPSGPRRTPIPFGLGHRRRRRSRR